MPLVQNIPLYSDHLLNFFQTAVFNAGSFEIFVGNDSVRGLSDSSILFELSFLIEVFYSIKFLVKCNLH